MSPEITITSEELRERVEDHLDRWIPLTTSGTVPSPTLATKTK